MHNAKAKSLTTVTRSRLSSELTFCPVLLNTWNGSCYITNEGVPLLPGLLLNLIKYRKNIHVFAVNCLSSATTVTGH